MSAAVERDTLQKGIYSRAINEVPFTADVTGASAMREPKRGWSEVTGPESSPRDKVGGSNERIRRQHAVLEREAPSECLTFPLRM